MTDTDKSSRDDAPGESAPEGRANLHEPGAILEVLLEYLPSGVSLVGPELELIACNAKFKELLDFPEELFAHGRVSLPQLVHFNAVRGDYGPGDPETITAAALERAAKKEPHVFERTRPNGVVLEVRGNPLPGGGFLTIYTDIGERKQTEKALRDSEAELRLLSDNVPAMILYVDRKLNCIFANRRYADFFGLAVADIVGKPLREIVGAAAYPQVESQFVKALEGHSVSYQRNVQLKSGEQGCIEVKVVPRAAEQGQIPGCYSMAIDITEQNQAAERIQHVAHHDSLTGLPNRLLFNDRLGQAITLARRDASQFALLYLDLDKFKPVNDTLGHDAGDRLLKRVAERIRAQVRESDTVARVGGDEFTVILRDISSRQDAAAVAEKIIATVAAPFLLGTPPQAVEIGTSIGIAVYPADAEDHETLIKLADAAMYGAKSRGNCFRFFEI